MTVLQQMVIPFTLMLFAINVMFAYTMYLPADQTGTIYLNLGVSKDMNDKIQSSITQIYTDSNILLNADSNGTTVDIYQKTTSEPAKQMTLNYFDLIVRNFSQLALGYWTWIDYFFNPLWGTPIALLGTIFKFFFSMIQAYGLLLIAQTLLSIFTGAR